MNRNNVLQIMAALLILIAIVFNPFIVGKILSPTGELHHSFKINIIFYEICCLLTGLGILFIKKKDKKSILIISSIVLSIIFFEIILHINPLIMGDDFANEVKTKYTTGLKGMYEYDFHTKMKFMKPNFKTKAYFNRYEWTHETDSKGFRNPYDITNPEVILLGDSFIYGHGVNQNQTVAYFMKEYLEEEVMNMARQGDSAYEQMYLLNMYAIQYRPKQIIYFFFSNDITDINNFLTKKDMEEFIKIPLEQITFKERKNKTKMTNIIENTIGLLANGPRSFKAYKQFNKVFKLQNNGLIGDNSNELEKQLIIKGTTLEWNYTKKAISQMNYASKKNNITFIVVPIIAKYHEYERDILEEFCKEKNILFIDTKSMQDVDKYYLPRDGHFSEEGAKEMARIVSKFIKQN